MRKVGKLMRRCVGPLACAGFAALLSAPLAGAAPDVVERHSAAAAASVQGVTAPDAPSDEAAMLLVGSALLAVAAVARRLA